MLTKLGKEKNVRLHKNFRLKYGTVDAKNLTAVYLEAQSWVQPTSDESDHKRSVTYLKKVAFNSIYNNLNRDLFKDKFIIDLDLRTSGMSVEKRSFMCLEVTLFIKKPIDFKSAELANHMIKLLSVITADLEKNKFSFKSRKK